MIPRELTSQAAATRRHKPLKSRHLLKLPPARSGSYRQEPPPQTSVTIRRRDLSSQAALASAIARRRCKMPLREPPMQADEGLLHGDMFELWHQTRPVYGLGSVQAEGKQTSLANEYAMWRRQEARPHRLKKLCKIKEGGAVYQFALLLDNGKMSERGCGYHIRARGAEDGSEGVGGREGFAPGVVVACSVVRMRGCCAQSTDTSQHSN